MSSFVSWIGSESQHGSLMGVFVQPSSSSSSSITSFPHNCVWASGLYGGDKKKRVGAGKMCLSHISNPSSSAMLLLLLYYFVFQQSEGLEGSCWSKHPRSRGGDVASGCARPSRKIMLHGWRWGWRWWGWHSTQPLKGLRKSSTF